MRRSVATDMMSVMGVEGRIPMQSHNRRTGQPVHTKSTFVHWSTGSVRLLLAEGAAPLVSTTDVRVPKVAYGRRPAPLPCEQQHRESGEDHGRSDWPCSRATRSNRAAIGIRVNASAIDCTPVSLLWLAGARGAHVFVSAT